MRKILICFLLLWPGYALCQEGRQNIEYRNYDPSTEIRIKGSIEEFISRSARHSNATGWHLKLKTSDKTWYVHLGPKWFYNEHKVKLSKGMEVEIEGSTIKMDDKEALIAKVIETLSGKIEIRDDSGKPYFSRSRNKK